SLRLRPECIVGRLISSKRPTGLKTNIALFVTSRSSKTSWFIPALKDELTHGARLYGGTLSLWAARIFRLPQLGAKVRTSFLASDRTYGAFFRNGSRALIVGRYSTCCRETRRGHVRSLSLVGKLFPTADPDHIAPLRTANFMTQQDIGGDYNDYIND